MGDDDDGHDTALARALHAQGALSLEALQACLRDARAQRSGGATLAGLIVSRRLADPLVVERALAGLAPSGPASRPVPGAGPAGRDPSFVASWDPETAGSAARVGADPGLVLPPVLGGYRVVRELARGGMGAVLEVVSEAGGVRYALKTLLPGCGEADRLRFKHEGELMARLEHPHVARIHQADLDGPTPWLVQDLLPGGSLDDRLRRSGPLPVEEAVRIVAKLARAMAHAHGRGVLHRDLKPGNVLFDDRGEPRVVDFGIARGQGDAGQRLTVTGELMGTPAFMAPEQAMNAKTVDARADVYALGAVLFAALTGRAPFAGASPLAVLQAVIEHPPPTARSLRPGVPDEVERVLARALAKQPDDRYPSADDLAAALEAVSSPSAGGRRDDGARGGGAPVALVATTVVVAVASFGLIAWKVRATPQDKAPVAPRAVAPPTLRLLAPAAPITTTGATCTLEVVASPGGHDEGPLEVVCGDAVRRVEPDVTSRLEVPLRPGRSRLEVVARVGSATSTAARLEVTRDVPPWWDDLPADRRPPLPLPAGVSADPAAPGRYVNAKDGQSFVWVPAPAGEVVQGTDTDPWDSPRHRVVITRGLFLGRTEVSWGQVRLYLRLARPGIDLADPGYPDDRPAGGLTWLQSRDYATWAGGRLPTDAEWELAARGTDGRRFPWGDAPPSARRCRGLDSLLEGAQDQLPTLPVDSLPDGASPYGCLHMYGNIFEWVSDIFVPYHGIPKPEPWVDPRFDEPFTLAEPDGLGRPIHLVDRCNRGGGCDIGPNIDVLRRYASPEGRPPPTDQGRDKRGLRYAIDARR